MLVNTTATTEVWVGANWSETDELKIDRPQTAPRRLLLINQDRPGGLELDYEETEDGYVVLHDALALYGVGPDIDEAVADLVETAALMYGDLSDDRYELSRDLRRRLRGLRLYLGWLVD